MIRPLMLMAIAALSVAPAAADVVYARGVVPATGTPVGTHMPACEPDQHSTNLAQRIGQQGLNAIGKATAALGLGGDPFNTRRAGNSNCVDMCVVTPPGANFTARGSITPFDWQGDLPSGLPGTVDPQNWAAIRGPKVTFTSDNRAQVVCYTFLNWSHNQARNVGIEVRY